MWHQSVIDMIAGDGRRKMPPPMLFPQPDLSTPTAACIRKCVERLSSTGASGPHSSRGYLLRYLLQWCDERGLAYKLEASAHLGRRSGYFLTLL